MNTSICSEQSTPLSSDNPFWWLCSASCVTDPLVDDDPQEPGRILSPFFVAAGHSITDEQYAQCRRCPVRRECLTWAYDQDIDFGFYGGVSPTTREQHPLERLLAMINRQEI